MTIDELINISLSNASAETIGRSFFVSGYTDKEKARFIEAMLEKERYEFIADVICCGAIKKEYNHVDFHNSQMGLISLNLRYFYMFTEICEEGGVSLEKFAPLLFASYSAQADSHLRGWAPAVTQYLEKLAASDYDTVLRLLSEHDKDYKHYGVIFKANKERTVSELVHRLIFEKHVNKAAIRKFLFDTKVNLIPTLEKIYASAPNSVHVREAVVRLLLICKHSVGAAEMISFIAENDKSKVISELIDKDAVTHKKTVKSGKKTEKTNEIGVKSDLLGEEKRFFDDMITGKSYTQKEFLKLIANPKAEAVASGLLFSVHVPSGGISEVVTVENGKVCNLDNVPTDISPDKFVKVLHMAELPSRYEFLRRLNAAQPFEQLKRKVYVPSEKELAENRSIRLSGTIIRSKTLRRNMTQEGFRITGKDEDGKSSYVGISLGDYIAVIEFTRVDLSGDDVVVPMKDIKFYRYKDAVKLRGSFYFENVPYCEIASVPPRVFSEGMYAIFRLSGTLNEK